MSDSESEKQRALRFLAAFTDIEGELRTKTKLGYAVGFKQVVETFTGGRRDSRSWSRLQLFADIRNILAHNTNSYPIVPTERIITEIEQFAAALKNPVSVRQFTKNKPYCITTDSTLTSVFYLVKEHNISQFPVVDKEGVVGLLTENGIVRWLALRAMQELTLVEFDDTLVEAVLKCEEDRKSFRFIAVDELFDNVCVEFSVIPELEAVLITQHGKSTESLLGIITRWDVVHSFAV